MSNIPKMPKIKSGIKYPPGQLEDQFDAVMKTDPRQYLNKIKEYLSEIYDYKECLVAHGYSVSWDIHTLDPDTLSAKKEIIIR
jgi:hypothetical protein